MLHAIETKAKDSYIKKLLQLPGAKCISLQLTIT